jgi:hypothetical protein
LVNGNMQATAGARHAERARGLLEHAMSGRKNATAAALAAAAARANDDT